MLSLLTGSGYSMPLWAAAKAARAAGTRNAKLLCLGDSTTMGVGAFNVTTPTNDVSASYPTVLAGLITAGSWQSFLGCGNATRAYNLLFDTRKAIGASWSTGLGLKSLGGPPWWTDAVSTDSFVFTPTTNVDTFDIYYTEYSGGGTFSWSVDGGAATNIDTNNAVTSIKKLSVSAGAAGAHALSIQRVSGAICVYNGAVAYNSAVKEVSVMNAGWSGGLAVDLSNSAAGSVLEHLRLIAPDLTILNCTINDWTAGTAAGSYTTQMQAIITAAKLSGDVLLVSGNPSDVSVATVAQQQTYIDVVRQLAQTNKCNFLSLTRLFGSYVAANAAGYMRDTRHPRNTGYAVIAAAIAALI